MMQVAAAVLAVVIMAIALTVGIGSTTPDAVARQQVEMDGVVGYGALRSAVDAYTVANRGAVLGDDAWGDLAGYLPMAPQLPHGLTWSASGGERPAACVSGASPSRPQSDGLRRLADRLGGSVASRCAGSDDPGDAGPMAVTIPLSTD